MCLGDSVHLQIYSTSDEPLIIATLLGLDLSPILVSNPAKRMNILWRMIGTSSPGID